VVLPKTEDPNRPPVCGWVVAVDPNNPAGCDAAAVVEVNKFPVPV
jgi:hypothetical protein